MKRLWVLAAVVLAVGLAPLATYADGHDQQWQHQHATEWNSHSKQWSEYDREWQAHRGDTPWLRQHAAMWHDWYQWHKDDGGQSGLGLHLVLDF